MRLPRPTGSQILAFLLWLSLLHNGFSHAGRFLLVGGGSEKNGANSWSTPAYRWAVEGKKVAVIGTSTGSLAPYLMQQCHAARAKEFAIASHDSADSQTTFDTLTSYDMIFFRGGDQYDYYRLYKGTKLLEAVNYLYQNDGTIGGTSAGMHILSEVLFTARYGSAYPDDCIENPNNSKVTLADDFLSFFPGILFDTHFAERARFGRLTGFMANWYLNRGVTVTGIGMDDMTCMTVDENGLGTVYGTGCANLYRAATGYSLNGTKLLIDSVAVVQLLQGCTYDFNTGMVGFSGLDREINTSSMQEKGNYTILASGSDLLTDNTLLLTDLVAKTGVPAAGVLILCPDQLLADSYGQKILELGASGYRVFTPGAATGSDTAFANAINGSRKFLFLKVSDADLVAFLVTPNGSLLSARLRTDGMISAFAGDNARFAGKTIVGNYLEIYASWYGDLTFRPGLALLRHTVIMPNTFLNSDIYENTATAVPYAMLKDTLKFGIWLTSHSYMKYQPVDGKTMLLGFGTAPVMILKNTGNLGGFASQTSTGSVTASPRMVAGFESLQLILTDATHPFCMGTVQPSGQPDVDRTIRWAIHPNPAGDRVQISGPANGFYWEISDLSGKVRAKGHSVGSLAAVHLSGLLPGGYLVRGMTVDGTPGCFKKIIKK